MIFEVKGARRELAQRALTIAAACLPLRTKFVVAREGERDAPRVLPHFVLAAKQRAAEERHVRSPSPGSGVTASAPATTA